MIENNPVKILIGALVGILLVGLDIFLMGYTMMFLWNNILSTILGLATLNFIQALALTLVADFVFTDHTIQRKESNSLDLIIFNIFIKLGYLGIGAIMVLFLL